MKKIFLLMSVICLYAWTASGASQDNYCFIPPYLTQNVKPNINLVLDFSGSMQFPAYIGCSEWNGYDSSKVADCGEYSTPAAALLYNTGRDYYGNFKSDMYYKYNAGGYFEENASCTTTNKIGTIASNCLSGNLLNWLTTTRTDVLRRILTGGRIKSSTTDVLESEGSRYIFTDTTLHCKFTVTAGTTLTRKLKAEDQSGHTCAIGTFSDYGMDTKVSDPATYITGIVQSMYPGLVDLELSVYNTSVGVAYRVGKNKALTDYTSAINSELAYNGTPTGEALREAKYYYQQSSSMTATGESTVIGKADYTKDPYYETGNLPAKCKKSFVLLISDGEWNGSVDPVGQAHTMHTTDLRTDTALPDNQTVTTYAVYAFGDGVAGRQAMITTALFGGYEDTDNNSWPYGFTSLPDSRTVTYPRSSCNPLGTWNADCSEWDKDRTGLPYNFFEGDDGNMLVAALNKAIQSILGKVSAGTAASILGNNDNSGASLLQAIFYPEKTFEAFTKTSWIGEIQAFWYYVDPTLNNITIREDTVVDRKLKLAEDRIAEFSFNGTETMVNLYADANGDGVKDAATPVSTVAPNIVKTLWRAGMSLWCRDESDRTIFTNDPTASTATKLNFTYDTTAPSIPAKLQPYLAVASGQEVNTIKYARGIDVSPAYRSRTVKMTTDLCDGTSSQFSKTWKLGDIINSTPKILSEVRLNSYNLKHPAGYNDLSYDKYFKSKDYSYRGTAYVGGNDGMLHAFNIGSNFIGGTQGVVAEIKKPDGSAISTQVNTTDALGKEKWAFIPKNMLPYLQYLALPDYKHLYFVDSTPLLIDASISPTKYKKDATTFITCDATHYLPSNTDAYSSCAKVTNYITNTQELSYDASTDPASAGLSTGTSWRTILLGSTGFGGATSSSQKLTTGLYIAIAKPNATSITFTRSVGSFLTDGWAVGDVFTAYKFANAANNGTFRILTVTATVITCTTASGVGVAEGPVVADLQQSVVQTPLATLGYSSFFALDVTEPITTDLTSPATYPKLLWEFSDAGLGFTTVTPAVIRIKDAAEDNIPRNGKWYVVLASGPTGPIGSNTFKAVSSQSLKIYVLDLATGNVVRTFSDAATSSTNTNFSAPAYAFAGSLSGSTIDVDKNSPASTGFYSDDAIYIGYTRADSDTAPTSWNKGGVLRLLTYNNPDPANWAISTVIDGVGPVTSAVTKLQDNTNHNLWLYFGTGRYYFIKDDKDIRQSLFGIKDPCFNASNTFTAGCNTSLAGVTAATSSTGATATGIVDQTDTIGAVDSTDKGWKIDLSVSSGTSYAKRVITDPISSTNGILFFTTFAPSTDICSYGGTTTIFSVNYSTGGVGSVNLKGELLMQLSTGAFEQVHLGASGTFSNSSGRETISFTGIPPKVPPALTSNANHTPSKRILHIKER